jgi:hypothetical protein
VGIQPVTGRDERNASGLIGSSQTETQRQSHVLQSGGGTQNTIQRESISKEEVSVTNSKSGTGMDNTTIDEPVPLDDDFQMEPRPVVRSHIAPKSSEKRPKPRHSERMSIPIGEKSVSRNAHR